MTLARQQWLFLAVALSLLGGLTALLVHNQLSVARSLADLTQAQELVRIVVHMRNIAVEVTTNRTESQELQWQAGMRRFARTLRPLQTPYAEEHLLLQAVRENVEDADQLFQRLLASAPAPRVMPAAGGDAHPASGRIPRALHFVLGDVSLMALRLSELQTAEVLAARQAVLATSTLLVAAMLAILVAYLVVFRKLVLIPINRLREATDRIAAGELDHRVAMVERNEIGDLGRRFDHMTEELQGSLSRMEAANKELDAFAYSVSHDLRAPLRGMDAFSRILLEKYAPQFEPDPRHCLQMIRDNAMQMGRLIDDLLAFSRLNQLPLVKEPVDQKVLVRATLESLAAEQKGRQIDLSVGELPPTEADPRLLKQVWVNLIANALKYTRGRDTAVIRIGSETKNGVPVYFVQDNGVGFDMRYAHKLFGVFQRLHRAEDYEGTGVGLAIVQRIVGRHGGRIWTQAAKGQGATFFFTLQEAGDHAEQ